MTEPQLWLIVLGGMLTTYLIRLSFVALVPPDRLPLLFRRGLNYIPPAVLAAILLPELTLTDGALDLSLSNPRLIAGALAALAAWRLRNTWLTIAVGMIALWLLS